jgi:hypothetical protein
VVFGIQASTLLADRLSELLRQWAQKRPTLRHSLPDVPAGTSIAERDRGRVAVRN